ncbi:paralemmin-3 isoform X2 [Sparus aurata]|uniref:Paralemmin 3 n=1 Tax=Sparus aurata TaxID=8175 RepID=A0A671U101_SPAAU|nr:paralemmin-1-like isoform X2 [Sparus aurata]
MEEADKYKQRLEAIAEKRRLQEEQDRARREMEDEKLRLQQLKRKSLRDQWLMEGPPLSPTSQDNQNPRSPLWGSQAQEMEERIDKLQSETQRLAEEEEKLKEKMEDGQTEAVKVGEAGAETTEAEEKTNQSSPVDETTAVLTNGGGEFEAATSHGASEQSSQSTTNGPVVASEGVISMKLEPGLSLVVSEAAPGQVPNININEGEEEEGTLVMRAERVIITDEGEDVPEEDQQETTQSEETPLPNLEAGQEGGEAGEEVVTETEAALETLTKPEYSEAVEPTADAQPANADGDEQGGVQTNENRDQETEADGQDNQTEALTCVQVQAPSNALEGTTVASVPVYSQATLTPEPEAESAAATSPEGAEATSEAQDPAPLPGQFQEVPLADPQENQRTAAGPGEQEPLLSQAKAPDTHAEPAAAANSPASTDTQNPTRASHEEEAPKRKTCQCCSVM